ncbi:MAG TPA: HIT domain-containing protein [Steroidobacteraceae bacterium]|nr:HIT domain-containing protein [Steroidobacteraceae bacterium]
MKNDKPELETAIHRQVAEARAGREPRVAARLFSGWVVFGERQFVRGYVLLLPDPVVPSLNALAAQERAQFLLDMARLGDALLKVTSALRINYAILGNAEPALHAHVIPRYNEEPPAMRTRHPWSYDWDAAPAFDRTVHGELAEQLRRELTRMGVSKPMRFDPGANAQPAAAAAKADAGTAKAEAGSPRTESAAKGGGAPLPGAGKRRR